ncbi:MAG: signal recognition particle-docking protein FtsY [Cyanobacteria bacterium J083]|nr:MAG: signal recognition particle-docking protein FtsY [Cyanobacteria bacterium J083]
MFNWFRRKFGDNKQQSEQTQTSEQEQQLEKQPEEQVQETAETETSTPTQEDYLAWAKAAYQNIQERKEKTTEPIAEKTEEVPQEAKEEEETVISEVTEETTETETEQTQKTNLDNIAEPTGIKLEATPEEATKTSLPAWMRQSAGLEKLKETAVEMPKVEEKVAQRMAAAQEIELDEDFIWSAQVLAKQGRRPDEISEAEITWLTKLRQGLGKTRRNLINQLKAVVGQGPLNQAAIETIEALLLQADVGIEATDYIIETLQNKLREEALPPDEAIIYLKKILCDILDQPLAEQADQAEFAPEPNTLNIWMLTGVNGAGKTTTIGKLAYMAKESGYDCIIAAADTFRAAAVEQVKIWGERTATPVIANPGKNTDPAAVVFDAISAALARKADLLLVDTAGRLQNKKNLMAELAKIRGIIDKKAPNAVVQSLLVLDATLGQNGLRQAQVFSEAAKLNGVVLTKLDGTAKGGVALAVSQQLNLPIRFIGAGEGIEDLRPFSSYEFVEALLSG